MLSTCPRTVIVWPGGNLALSSATIFWTAAATLPRSRSCTLAKTSKTGCTFEWLMTAGTSRRSSEARLLRSCCGPVVLGVTDVFISVLTESTRFWGVCTATR